MSGNVHAPTFHFTPSSSDSARCTGGRRGPTNNEISRSRAWCQSQGVEQESGSPASGQRGGAARQRQLQPSLTYSKRRQRQRRTDPAYSPTQDACDAWTTSQVLGVGARDKFSPREPTSTKITRPARGVARGCTVFDVRLLDAVSKKKSNHVSFVASKRIELPPRPPLPPPLAHERLHRPGYTYLQYGRPARVGRGIHIIHNTGYT
ncbi:hypothetical protein V8E55_002478 [Tylopilus felleus]